MTRTSQLRYALSRPFIGPVFRMLGARALRNTPGALGLSRAELDKFVAALWNERYSKIRVDPWEFLETFGRTKLEMVLEMARHAARLHQQSLFDVVHNGRWEVKFGVRDRFDATDSTSTVRAKWAERDVLFWNVIAGLKWQSDVFEPKRLPGAAVLDYGCNVGALSYLARRYGATELTLVDVPGAPLEFADSFLAGPKMVLPVTGDGPPKGLANRRVQVAFCHHVLEHVPEPLAVVRAIHQSLESGGVFYVTYAAFPEAAGGINLQEAQRVRPSVLDFLRSSFRVLSWHERRVEYRLQKL